MAEYRSTGAATSSNVRFFAAGSKRLDNYICLCSTRMVAEMAGREIGAAVASTDGWSFSFWTFFVGAIASGQSATDETVSSKVAIHSFAVCSW